MKPWVPFAFGLVFGLGLAVSGMTSPSKVVGFLDVAGDWDPSLAVVMVAAVATAAPLFALRRRRNAVPDASPRSAIDARLVSGAAIFGLGWGLAGICPGPALVNLSIEPLRAGVFVVAMAVGAWLSSRLPAPQVRDDEPGLPR